MPTALAAHVADVLAHAPRQPAPPPTSPQSSQTRQQWLADVARCRTEHDSSALLLSLWWRPPVAPRPVALVAYHEHAGLTLCVYSPGTQGPRPALLVFHGGAFWMGGGVVALTLLDPLCRRLCDELGAVVVNVDYRLAPEHVHPAQRDDGCAAVRWVVDSATDLRVDPTRVGVLGFSSGGHLAACVAQQLGPGLAAQALVMPVLDVTSSQPSGLADPAWREAAIGLRGLYFGQDLMDPAVSPLFAPDLSGLAPTYVLTAEHDPLRDDGRLYAERLAASGVPVRHQEFDATHVVATSVVQEQMDAALIAALKEVL